MPTRINYNTPPIGARFGDWVVIAHAGRYRKITLWKARCSCGIVRNLRAYRLVAQSPPCKHRKPKPEKPPNPRYHGRSKTPEYKAFRAMHRRCENPTNPGFKHYGQRGIKVCKRWDDFQMFWNDMGPRPSAQHSIERINNDGDYEPKNCKWATRSEQCRNRRTSRRELITWRGESHTLVEWVEITGMGKGTLQARLFRAGWTVENAFSIPVSVHNRSHQMRRQAQQ